jgi:serine/threonine protein kinase
MLSRDYPFIIRMYAVFHDFQRVYFLLEHAPCGNFYDFSSKLKEGFDNECIQWFSGQIICAIRYLHSKLIVRFFFIRQVNLISLHIDSSRFKTGKYSSHTEWSYQIS